MCEYAFTSPNFPEANDYPITVTGNNPNPPNFAGRPNGGPVPILPSEYTITETFVDTTALLIELIAVGGNTEVTVEGDCIVIEPNIPTITGTMSSGGSQECTIINTIEIEDGSVPST